MGIGVDRMPKSLTGVCKSSEKENYSGGGMFLMSCYDDTDSLINWLRICIKRMNQKQIQVLFLTCWALWMNRNGELHGEGRRSTMVTVEFINKYQNEFNDAQTRAPHGSAQIKNRWVPPPMDYVKVNFDAAMQEQQG
ncbi:hypothetical protein REPUB_Repub04eG0207000 [Reevesia pubescens]